MSDLGPWRHIVVHHAREAFGDNANVAREWRALTFTAAPDYARAVDQYEHFIALLRTSGAQIIKHPALSSVTPSSKCLMLSSIRWGRTSSRCRRAAA